MHLLSTAALLPVAISLLVLTPKLERIAAPNSTASTTKVRQDLVTVRINVRDQKGPLAGAAVVVDGGQQTLLTDVAGNSQLNTYGGTTILVRANRYKTYRLIVSAKGGEYHMLVLRQLDGSEIVATAPLIHVSGFVFTPEGKPMPRADVSVAERGWLVKTDEAGRYEIDVPQNNILSISKLGYEPRAIAVVASTTSFSPKMLLREGIDPTILDSDSERARDSRLPALPKDYKLVAGELITEADQNPTYPGGPDKLAAYLATNVHYPQEARQNRVTGSVFVRFVVNTDGSIDRIRLLKGLNYGTDEEAVRVVARMPNWTPGKQKGQIVPVQYTLPIRFPADM